ncbi:hypothetical protein F4825DRAFT_468843 [Nemania diffusa]|nr:hypothetical protein F4825DRAFT_468843 [Nemania diffusa]
MNGRVSKAWTCRSHVKPSKALQEMLLGAVASNAGTEHPRSQREQSPEDGDLTGDATPLQSRKRQLDEAESDLSPAKRARLMWTDTQHPGGEDEKAEQAGKTTLQQPKPNRPKRPYASFLKDFVDPVHAGPHPTSLHSFVSEWLQAIGSDRERRCRSDSHLYRLDNDPVPRQLTRSAPEMDYTRDADGFVVPLTLASTRSCPSYQPTEDSASSTASVRHPSYRQNNLSSNGIRIRDSGHQLPDYISSHIETLRTKQGNSPDLSREQMAGYSASLDMLERGCSEADVKRFLEDAVFPKASDLAYGPSTCLETARSSLMSSHLTPNKLESPFRVTQPKPDLLYGYSSHPEDGAFTEAQLLAQTGLHPQNARFAEATTRGLRFPFLAIEFKAAGGTRGDLWVATNQCAGASSACLNAIDRLNTSLPNHPSVQRVDNLSYSIAVNNNMAQLYISWKGDDLKFYLQRVGAFLLSDPEHFKSFRKQVRNILDWGKDTRLTQIKDALDIIFEENSKKAAEHAKSRQPPTRSNSVQGQSGETDQPNRDLHSMPQQDAYEEPSFPPDAGDSTAFQDEGLPFADNRPEDIQPV